MRPGQRATIIGANLLVPAGVLVFGWNAAAAASGAFLMYTELHENRLAQLYGRLRRWEDELKTRAKDRSNP